MKNPTADILILDAIDRLQWQETRPAVKAGG